MRKILLMFLFCVSASFAVTDFFPQSFSANFEQILVSGLSGKEKKSFGFVEYKYPGHIRFEVERPEKVIFVSNKEKTWYYTAPFVAGEPGELTVQNTGKMVLVKFFDAMKKGLASNELYKVKMDKTVARLFFEQKVAKEIGIHETVLNFSKESPLFSDILSLEIVKADKSKVTLKLTDIKMNVIFPVKRFLFEVPPNTRVNN